jgi:ribonucleotide monophosphatase NagD (HAD superfamily)
LADAYVALGGEALYCGKLHAALDQAAAFRGGAMPPLARVLAIGDSVRTDLAGAASLGMDFLFVISGLHADQFGLCGAPAFGALAASDAPPLSIIRRLLW